MPRLTINAQLAEISQQKLDKYSLSSGCRCEPGEPILSKLLQPGCLLGPGKKIV